MHLTDEQLTHFNEQGYLVVENVLNEAEVDSLWAEYSDLLDELAQRFYAEGKLSSTYADLPFDERYIAMLNETDAFYEHLDISLPMVREMAEDAGVHTGEAVFNMLTNPKILDIAESILGAEISSNPIQHARIKPPERRLPNWFVEDSNSNINATAWHQDEAVGLSEASESTMLTVWVAMTDALVENGCMVCLPGSHKKEGELTTHCPGKVYVGEIRIPDLLIDDKAATAMPVKRGGVVLLNQRTEHGSLRNVSDKLRWSFDLRYNRTGEKTGRPIFPDFVARSKANPESELRDVDQWTALWDDARSKIVSGEVELKFNDRWDANAAIPLCA